MRDEDDEAREQEYDRHDEHDRGHYHGYEHVRAHWMKHWMRHSAMVPKGFLRYQLLKMLREKPMSGSEIMSELESKTNGYWKPSPGSIYPLLAWLHDQSYIKEADLKESGIRRYTLTEQGKSFLENETKSREEINKRMDRLGPMWYGPEGELRGELHKVSRSFGKAARDVFHEIRREPSKEAIQQAMKTLGEITVKLQELTMTLQKLRSDALHETSQEK